MGAGSLHVRLPWLQAVQPECRLYSRCMHAAQCGAMLPCNVLFRTRMARCAHTAATALPLLYALPSCCAPQAEVNRTFQFTGLDSGSFYPFLVYTVIATAISSVFMIIPWLIAPQRVDLDKSSAYECGFDAFGEARQTFSVSFYLVSIMYLLFDIEICYLLPYVMCHANAQMYWTMNMFLALLVVGFVYEWGVGALEWRN